MFSKSQVNQKTMGHNSNMNDNQLINKVVIRRYTQHLPLISIINNILNIIHDVVITCGWSLNNSSERVRVTFVVSSTSLHRLCGFWLVVLFLSS